MLMTVNTDEIKEKLDELSVAKIKELASQLKIKGYSKYKRKRELINFLISDSEIALKIKKTLLPPNRPLSKLLKKINKVHGHIYGIIGVALALIGFSFSSVSSQYSSSKCSKYVIKNKDVTLLGDNNSSLAKLYQNSPIRIIEDNNNYKKIRLYGYVNKSKISNPFLGPSKALDTLYLWDYPNGSSSVYNSKITNEGYRLCKIYPNTKFNVIESDSLVPNNLRKIKIEGLVKKADINLLTDQYINSSIGSKGAWITDNKVACKVSDVYWGEGVTINYQLKNISPKTIFIEEVNSDFSDYNGNKISHLVSSFEREGLKELLPNQSIGFSYDNDSRPFFPLLMTVKINYQEGVHSGPFDISWKQNDIEGRENE